MESAATGLQTHGHGRYDSNHHARGTDGLAEKAREQVPQTTDSEQVVGVQNLYARYTLCTGGSAADCRKKSNREPVTLTDHASTGIFGTSRTDIHLYTDGAVMSKKG